MSVLKIPWPLLAFHGHMPVCSVVLGEKSEDQEVKVIRSHLLGTVNVCTKCCPNAPSECPDISHITKNTELLPARVRCSPESIHFFCLAIVSGYFAN